MRSCEKRYLDCEMAIPTILSFAESRLEIVQGQVGDGAFQIVEIHSETQADKLQPLRRLWCRFRAGCRVVHGMNWSSSSQSASQLKENPTGPGWSLGLRSRRGHHVRGVIEIRAVDLRNSVDKRDGYCMRWKGKNYAREIFWAQVIERSFIVRSQTDDQRAVVACMASLFHRASKSPGRYRKLCTGYLGT